MIHVSNAAGVCKTVEDVRLFAHFGLTSVVWGSITPEPRDGNEGLPLNESYPYTINSLGMPNPGLQYCIDNMPEMVDACHAEDKKLTVSLAGFCPEDYISGVEALSKTEVDGIELNLGCPNIAGHRVMTYDPRAIEEIVRNIPPVVDNVVMKLSPVFDQVLMVELASVLYGQDIVAINTIPNALSMEGSMWLGGLSGPAVKPIGLGQVYQWRDLMPLSTHITGVGGIVTPEDAADYISAGADAVQLNSAYLTRGPSAFYRVLVGLEVENLKG